MVSLFGKKPAGPDAPIPSSGGSVFGSTTIAWEDQYKQDNVMWKVPRNIRLNDNIVVREDEIAVFYRDGKVLTYFDQPNRYALTDFNAPIVGNLLKFFTGVQQQAEVFYLQKRVMDGKFGSTQPYQFTDPTFGIVNLRVFGEYRWRVSSPENFINQFVGTFNAETPGDVEDRLKEQMIILVYNALGKMKSQGLKVTDLAGNLTNIEQVVLSTSPDNFGQYGVEINKVSGLTISLPEEVQKAIDTRSQMQVLGVNYLQYQAGQAMTEAASNPSGVAGVGAGLGVGLGAGVGVGSAFGQAMMGGMGQGATKSCSNCGSIIPINTAFCPNCGASQPTQQ
ncbi:MAG TPA: SPFH domain-containing protein, partial [Nitrososphaerales archaeon]|nr:SPFH domain-containing protein [Nitrososphaerales archaeon]